MIVADHSQCLQKKVGIRFENLGLYTQNALQNILHPT